MDSNCPDGMDCPWWATCQDGRPVGDPCPLLDKDVPVNVPLDELIWRWPI